MLWGQQYFLKTLVVCFAIYGLWMFALTAWHKFSRGGKTSNPFISILVIARNHEASIEGIIRWLLNLNYDDENGSSNLEIVAVCSGSEDQTPVILERLCREYPRLITQAVSEIRAYEQGLELCSGDVICLLDLSKQVVPEAGYAMERMLHR